MYQTSRCVCATLVIFLLILGDTTHAASPPHIIIILADDLGWNDVSFHGSNQFLTPNIDALAYSGVILQDYYTQPICTPARGALLTGRHPIHNGMQHGVIYAPQPWGLPLSEIIMPQYLKSRGYMTHGVGKWHLGFSKAEYTPSKRGFDSYYGSWLGHQNHFTHMAYARHRGYDLHRNLDIAWEGKGKYAADLFTEEAETIINRHNVEQPLFLYLSHTAPHAPLQAPQEEIDKLTHIPEEKRRIYAAMVSKVDESVGRVTQALKNKNMLNNSVILFLSDNGGATNGFNGNVASNWPLRGGKDTLWEGGVRGVGLIWSPLLKGVPRVHHGLFNVQDWLPTLLSATSSKQTKEISQLDGVSQWKALNNEAPDPYKTMLHNIDPMRKIAALREGKWKIIVGRAHRGMYDGWYGREKTNHPYDIEQIKQSTTGKALMTTSRPLPKPSTMQALRSEATISCIPKKHKGVVYTRRCKPHRAPCLFNIEEDPCEINNVARLHPQVVGHMLENLLKYHLVRPRNKGSDMRSNPIYWNRTWTNWQDFIRF